MYKRQNLRLAERVRKCCPRTRIVYFISPQVWAWHRGRIPKMVRMLDLMMCIFPFEAPLFQEAGLRTEFVGHPLVDEIASIRKEGVREPSLVGLFPGSRNREIDRHFPVFIEVVSRLSRERPELSFETGIFQPFYLRNPTPDVIQNDDSPKSYQQEGSPPRKHGA
mgnify:FL=1